MKWILAIAAPVCLVLGACEHHHDHSHDGGGHEHKEHGGKGEHGGREHDGKEHGKGHGDKEHDGKEHAGKGEHGLKSPAHASSLVVAKIADDQAYKKSSVEVQESAPVQFVLVLTRDLPLGGYDAAAESVGKPDAKGHIVAKLREIPPEGAGPTMIDTKKYRIELGSLKVGKYVVELHVRSSKDGKHELKQSIEIEAKS